MKTHSKPVIAISSCLLGNRVRYDGLSKGMPELYQHIQQHFDLVSICPEVEIGLSVPRPAVQLTGNPLYPQMTGRDNPSINITDAMLQFCKTRPNTLKNIGGYIFKSRSPSCGIRDVPVIDTSTTTPTIIKHDHRGLFANAIMQHRHDLPVVDENELSNAADRNQFMQQVHDYIERHPDLFSV